MRKFLGIPHKGHIVHNEPLTSTTVNVQGKPSPQREQGHDRRLQLGCTSGKPPARVTSAEKKERKKNKKEQGSSCFWLPLLHMAPENRRILWEDSSNLPNLGAPHLVNGAGPSPGKPPQTQQRAPSDCQATAKEHKNGPAAKMTGQKGPVT